MTNKTYKKNTSQKQSKSKEQNMSKEHNRSKDQSGSKKKSSAGVSEGFPQSAYDAAVLACFLEKQLQLFPEKVAETPEEAADFLEMCFATVVKSKKDVRRYFDETGTDIEGEDLLSAAEVFPVGDGRYLIVEG